MYDKHGKTKLFSWFFAFLSMLIIALFLVLQVGFTVDAEEVISGNFQQFFGITLSGLFTSDGKGLEEIYPGKALESGVYYFNDDTSNDYNTYLNAIKNITVPDTVTINNVVYDIKNQYTNFGIFNGAYNYYLILAPADAVFYGKYLVNPGGSQGANGFYCSDSYISYSLDITNGNISNPNFFNTSAEVKFRDGYSAGESSPEVTRLCYQINGNNTKLILCNCPCYSQEWIYDEDLLNTPPLYNPTRMISNDYDLYYDVFNGTNGGGNNDENASNNLTMTNGDWSFTNSKYTAPYSSSFPNSQTYPTGGNVSYSFTPTQYQFENASEFKVCFSFAFDYDVKYQNVNNTDIPFYKTSSITDNWKSTGNIRFVYNSGRVDEIVEVPLSTFISNGNSQSWTWNDLFDNLLTSSAGNHGSLSSLILASREIKSVYYNKFNLEATAWIDVVSGDFMGQSSGFVTETYNPMSKQGTTTDKTGNTNKNPYVPDNTSSNEEEDDGSNTPNDDGNAPGPGGNDGGGSSSSSSTGNITINNTFSPTNNGGSGGASGGGTTSEASTFYNVFNPVKWMITKLAANNTSTGEELKSSLGVNNWLTLLTDTFGFLPSSFYTSLGLFFTISLGILIIAIIFRVVLDLL